MWSDLWKPSPTWSPSESCPVAAKLVDRTVVVGTGKFYTVLLYWLEESSLEIPLMMHFILPAARRDPLTVEDDDDDSGSAPSAQQSAAARILQMHREEPD